MSRQTSHAGSGQGSKDAREGLSWASYMESLPTIAEQGEALRLAGIDPDPSRWTAEDLRRASVVLARLFGEVVL